MIMFEIKCKHFGLFFFYVNCHVPMIIPLYQCISSTVPVYQLYESIIRICRYEVIQNELECTMAQNDCSPVLSLTLTTTTCIVELLFSRFRRYGVVESRFCFEGGSRCGKGEGLYVLVTDQAEEITRTLQAASEGRMTSTRRRPTSRNMSGKCKCM